MNEIFSHSSSLRNARERPAKIIIRRPATSFASYSNLTNFLWASITGESLYPRPLFHSFQLNSFYEYLLYRAIFQRFDRPEYRPFPAEAANKILPHADAIKPLALSSRAILRYPTVCFENHGLLCNHCYSTLS